MSTKDLFERSHQIIASSSLSDLDVESAGYISEYIKDQNRIEPHVDFGKPENFAKYGSAQEYYNQSLKWIYNEYPYDGSLKEQLEWRNKSTLLDTYIYDNRYPKSTGYGIISSDNWGTLSSAQEGGYGAPASADYEYINLKGGPNSFYGSSIANASLKNVFDSKSNTWDDSVTGSEGAVTATRESNLQTNLAQGVTVEFWLQTGSLSAALTEKQVVFDLWNGQLSSSAEYGRLTIELTGSTAGSPFLVTVMSGTDGYSQQSIGSGLDHSTLSSWKHCAFSFANSGSTIVTKLYQDGVLNDTMTTGTDIGEIRNPIEANIGALTSAPSGNVYTGASIEEGWGKLSGSIDEFRFWKTKRSSKEVGRYWFTSNLGGGTNTDFANLDLGVYYKFNEGITGVDSTDSSVLDYSGRITNGTWTGYPGSSARNTGSAINSASAGTEDLDPIIHSNHPDIGTLNTELTLSGSVWDYENNSSLFYTMPSWIIDEDEGNGDNGDLKKLTQVMGSYFDNLDLLIGELSKFNVASYVSSSAQGTLFKPYPYAQTALRSHGMDAPELFSNIDILEYYANRNETQEFEQDVHDVKNLIYSNIYNNLADIYKAKGTEKAFRNLIRCFGVGDDLIRINAYADNSTYRFDTKRRAGSHKTKAVNFNHTDRFAGTVYQYADASNLNSVSFISGSSTAGLTLEDSFPITMEAEFVFPEKIDKREENAASQEFPFLTASLFGIHTAQATSPTETDMTWAATDPANFQVFAIRDKIYSKDVKFMLSSSAPFPIPEITSGYFMNTYESSKWNFAVRLKPHGYPHSFASGALDNNYVVEFYGVNYIADRKINEFSLTGSVPKQDAENFLIAPKRIYVGAHYTNFTGSVIHQTDVKATSARFWMDYLDNEAIQNHAIDPGNFGHPRPNRSAFLLETDLENVEVPELESLALAWDFDTVTTSDASGRFDVQDITSGSIAETSRYGWLGKVLKYQHTGRGDSFPANATGSVENQYLYAATQRLPEMVFGDDNIRVLSQEETEVFTRETRPTKTYYAFEKSMYQVISDEIINYFGSIVDFNNLIGEPKNRYRQEYKDIKYLRQFFFERVGNTPDLDKFVDYYKWIDATLEAMLMQLVPASAQTSDGIDNVVESHILERNKYQSKFPTLEFHVSNPEGGIENVGNLPSWRFAHRPISGLQSDNCEYWKQRAERNDSPISSGDAGVDSDRNLILTASLQVLNRSHTTPYRYAVEKNPEIHGGVNYSESKKGDFYRGVNFPHGPMSSIGLPLNVLQANNVDVQPLKDCDDTLAPNQKRKYSFGTRNGRAYNSGSFDGIKGEIAMPFNILSASQGIGGYNTAIQDNFLSSSQLVNLHNDGYGLRNVFSMQGPFTEKFVGGIQSRHVKLNKGSDNQYNRPESWRLLLGGGPGGSGSIGLTGPDYGGPYPDPTRERAWFFREETAKRPINIRNIQQTTSSIGNYEKTYQVVQTSGRSTNNFWFNDNGVTLPERYTSTLPQTTNVHTLVGVRPYTQLPARRRGNTFLPGTNVGGTENAAALRRVGNRFFPYKASAANETKRTVFPLPERTVQDVVIVERFSAPGGPEINSLGFLDIMAAEKSAYNALPWRNLSVRGSGSGEEIIFPTAGGTIKVSDHLGKRRGLRTLASLHAGQFGSDATYGSITADSYVTSPSFYKINRNVRFRIEGTEGSYSTASVYDNWHIQHPIPQNDSQYSWINGSFLSGSTPLGHMPPSGQTSGSNGFSAAIIFLSSSLPDYTASVGLSPRRPGSPIDFVGLNSSIYDQTGSAFNVLSSSTLASYRNPKLDLSPGGTFRGGDFLTTFNALMLHRNGPYGYSSWRQVRNQYHSLVRQMRENNTISIIDPDSETRTGYQGYTWGPSPKTLNDIFGGKDSKKGQDRTVLQYHEPVVQQKYKAMELNGKASGLPVEVKATYGNQKTYFVNSKLNEKLNINENQKTSADSMIDGFRDEENRLVNIKYSESVYPSDVNVYRPYIRQRTSYVSSFWRDDRGDRNQVNVTGGMGIVIPRRSMWPLDARTGFTSSASPGITVGVQDDVGFEGTLQNPYTTVHSYYPGCGPALGPFVPGGSIANITASAIYARRHTLVTGSSARATSTAFEFLNSDLVPFSGDAPWDAGEQSGKYPFYDSYNDYVSEMRTIGKDYSILPEYRMSDRIDYVVKEGGDIFDDISMFCLTGALANTTSSNQDSFYKVYSHSDFMKYFNVIKNDVTVSSSLSGNPTELTIRCKALLKLLPYDGFYPASRTLQMASLFSQSYGSNVDYVAGASNPAGAFRPFLTPLFAPGIVFNTIKSGIAVDFPVLTDKLFISASADAQNYYISNEIFDYRVPFEATVEPQNYLKNLALIDMEPHPSCSINATASWNGDGDSRYRLAMHNFLAETPEFFLENQSFSSFISSPEDKFKEVEAGKKYHMRVRVRKSFHAEGISTIQRQAFPQITSGSETICMYSRPSAFGPPVLGAITGVPIFDLVSGSYFGGSNLGNNGPFTPPYYNGSGEVIFEFNPTESKRYTLQEIQSQITSSYRRFFGWNIMTSGSGPMGSNGHIRPETNSTQISASVNLFGKVSSKDLFQFQNVELTDRDQWVIQTKFETPILNFIDASSSATPIVDSGFCSGGAETRPYGMWHQYGRLPTVNEGIYLEIDDIPSIVATDYGGSDGSIADIVGFNKTSQKLGNVAPSKTIREAVVVVPFVERDGQRVFFSIDKRKIDTAINGFESGPSANLSEAPILAGDSIRQMVDSMQRYVFPPSMDFITYRDNVDPFSMYVFEFEHKLNQQDLVDIWQNLPPRIGRAFDKDAKLSTSEIMQTKEITHRLNDEQLLSDIDSKLQWMVFKVKQKAERNYWRKTVLNNINTSIPTELSSQGGLANTLNKSSASDFLAGGSAKGTISKDEELSVSYNWPYDFFSLVELAKVDEEVIFGSPVSVTVDRDIPVGTNLTQDGVTDFVVSPPVADTIDKNIPVGTNLDTSGIQNSPTAPQSVNKNVSTTTLSQDGVSKVTTTSVNQSDGFGSNLQQDGITTNTSSKKSGIKK